MSGTPLDQAISQMNNEVAELLQAHGAEICQARLNNDAI